MKLSTRRYAKTQLKWINNKFNKEYKNSIKIHSVDTSDLIRWDENILGNSIKIFENYLSKYEENIDANLNVQEVDNNQSHESVFEYNKCEICDRVFVNKFQWQCNLFML
jgi:tRNA A37 N6-isopentenylltransferase MiaA